MSSKQMLGTERGVEKGNQIGNTTRIKRKFKWLWNISLSLSLSLLKF